MKEKFNESIHTFYKLYNENLPILIESFVEYYGEEHRGHIESIIYSLNIHFWVDYLSIFSVIGEISEDLYGKIEIIKKYEFFIQSEIAKAKLSKSQRKDAEAILRFLGKNNNMYPIRIVKMMIKNEWEAAAFFNPETMCPEIMLPIFLCTEKAVFHEINHLVGGSHLWVKVGNKYPYIAVFNNESVDELINDASSYEILEIFKRRGGILCEEVFETENGYEHKHFLVREFYDEFKDLIKEVLITGNTNLFKKLGFDNIREFEKLINYLYNKGKVIDLDKAKIRMLIQKMKLNMEKEKDYDYEAYFKELEEKGLRVRRMTKM